MVGPPPHNPKERLVVASPTQPTTTAQPTTPTIFQPVAFGQFEHLNPSEDTQEIADTQLDKPFTPLTPVSASPET